MERGASIPICTWSPRMSTIMMEMSSPIMILALRFRLRMSTGPPCLRGPGAAASARILSHGDFLSLPICRPRQGVAEPRAGVRLDRQAEPGIVDLLPQGPARAVEDE